MDFLLDKNMKIQDESNDKKYFTIIPNFILNHSTAIDQALYMQMKRIAGDNGTCNAGYRYFVKQLGIGFKAYQKSLKYLIDHKWITFLGTKQSDRNRGKKEINIYRVNDIWQMNNKHYCGAESNRSQSHCGAESNLTAVSKVLHCGAESKHKKNYKKEQYKNIKNSKITTLKDGTIRILKDGSKTIKRFGKWVDYNNTNIQIDLHYYSELNNL